MKFAFLNRNYMITIEIDMKKDIKTQRQMITNIISNLIIKKEMISVLNGLSFTVYFFQKLKQILIANVQNLQILYQ